MTELKLSIQITDDTVSEELLATYLLQYVELYMLQDDVLDFLNTYIKNNAKVKIILL